MNKLCRIQHKETRKIEKRVEKYKCILGDM